MQEQIVLRQSICEPQNNFANDKKMTEMARNKKQKIQ